MNLDNSTFMYKIHETVRNTGDINICLLWMQRLNGINNLAMFQD